MFAAMLLADARLPTGGHAFSSGLEPALFGGLEPNRVRELMIGRATTTSRVEAGAAVVARSVILSAVVEDPSRWLSKASRLDSSILDADQSRWLSKARNEPLSKPHTLADVERAWAARTPAPALREASRELARGYLRLAGRLWPDSAGLAAVRELGRPSRAVVLGAMAVELDLDPKSLARLVIYDEAAGAAAALLKLEPRDPAEVSAWVLDACAAGEPYVDDLANLTDPAAIPASGAPQTEGWAQAHAATNRRLFRG